jgi:hypothetical protein
VRLCSVELYISVENIKETSVDRSTENIILVAKQVFVWKEGMKHGNPRWNTKARLRSVPEILCFFSYLTISYKMHNCFK